ncbi:MAG: hypothetical protein HY835_12535 [Anaerolineae bacterium]|nr:hypothetical protein [Anaerolineae bacterium]
MNAGGCVYEIRVAETLDRMWAEWLCGMSLLPAQPGEAPGTLLRGPLADQASLYGLLTRLRDLNLTLLEVRRVE